MLDRSKLLVLHAVDPLGSGGLGPLGVLAFSGPLGAALDGGTHAVTHPALGSFELFVSGVEQPRSDRRYEAVVDRSVARTGRKRVLELDGMTGTF
jgi:hypothetical protein